eukprot:TRINITY_DN15756_c0_g1_i1.p1 TRINITY_DN15756_c0_g1~~TRINITY_DN15756_c0_g1_i1.p1  ORF type:complete len:315 (-),score=59.41 TRINITY_DN15756_c0_g1_i1:141-1085(-)
MKKANIQVIDFSPFLNNQSSDEASRQQVVQQVRNACEGVGFLFAKNIGFSDAEIFQMFEISKKLFSLPKEKKEAAARKSDNRGYIASNVENVDPSNKHGDLKEAWNIGRDQNRFPEAIQDEIKNVTEAFFSKALKSVLLILETYALALNLPRDFFAKNHFTKKENPTTLRLLYYPPYKIDEVGQDRIRAGVHSDYGTITFLWQNGVGGLQVLDPKTAEWQFVEPVIGATCIVNTADLLMRWTNDLFISTKHCVRPIPSQDGSVPERYSIALFVHPDDDIPITCLDTCCSDEIPAKYKPVLSSDYLQQKLNQTYI